MLLCLAVVLLFGTVSALTLPASTMQPQCGFAEHTHTDACYTQVEDGAQETLICTEAHKHNARCYGTWVVACGKAEHTHTEACFPEAAAFSAEQETAMLKISLLYGDEQPQSTYPDGVFSDTTSTMAGYLRLEPSNASEGETRPSAEDDIPFRVTDDPVGRGSFGKVAYKGDIYDVGIYKTNPYPWKIDLSNARPQPLQHIVIQDRKIEENGKTVLENPIRCAFSGNRLCQPDYACLGGRIGTCSQKATASFCRYGGYIYNSAIAIRLHRGINCTNCSINACQVNGNYLIPFCLCYLIKGYRAYDACIVD